MSVTKTLKDLQEELKSSPEALERLRSVAKLYEGDDKVVSSKTLTEAILSQPEEVKMMSGLPKLDEILDGFRPKQLVVLTGITKHGKTTFAMDLVDRLKDQNPLVLAFEEPPEELIRKYLERDMEVPLFFTPQNVKERNLNWIESKIIESKAKYDSKIVFIDHLDYIDDVNAVGGDNQTYQVKRVMQEIKSLAKRADVIIVLLTHLRKVQLDRSPTLEDIRGSAAISQEADTVMVIWRKTHREGGELVIEDQSVLAVQANRRTGRTGNVTLEFVNGRFTDQVMTEEVAEARLKKLEKQKQSIETEIEWSKL